MATALLQRYRAQRDFKKTPEPKGRTEHARFQPIFVIQKHDASHLHYDFRLEAEGVLKSWAVPKGPSTDPSIKRLAIPTEDHPLDYAGFEGVIPQGQYGGGNVIVWDRGTYQNLTTHHGRMIPLTEGLERGHITISLQGEKLHGAFALTRTGFGKKPQWLLVKIRDQNAFQPADPVESLPESVVSGRTVEDVSKPAVPKPADMPGWISPMLATLVDEAFDRPGWIFEPKLDGERCLAYQQGKQVRLFSRNQKELDVTYPEVIQALARQSADSFVVDGEIVAFAPGTKVPSFKTLQQRMHLHNAHDVMHSSVQIYYYLFDILFLNGQDLRALPLLERKAILERTLRISDVLKLSPYIQKQGAAYYQNACHHKWEGVIAKRADSAYQPGRSRDWLKFKCLNEQEFVIGGYSDPQGSRGVLGALLIGYYDQGQLKFAGKVGTGFDARTLAQLAKALAPLQRKTSPFVRMDIPQRGLHWVEPKLVAQIGFAEWTPEGKLRQPRYFGMRDDKPARDVAREKSISDAEAVASPVPSPKPAPISARAGPNELHIGGHIVSVSHLNKVYYPSTGFTKGQMLDYYIKAAPALLPHLRNRPLMLKRYPDGVEGNFFYEKQAPSYRPPWLRSFVMPDPKSNKRTAYCLVNDLASLIWLANLATLEWHTMLARAPKADVPTLIAFDLDPGPPADILNCAAVALSLRAILKKLKLKSFLKTSGGKGLHLYIPLNTKTTYTQTQDFAHGIALLLERQQPQAVVSTMRKELRKGKVLVDWSQNSRHKTTVSAYSLRAQPVPSVSTPITWEELEQAADHKDPMALRFTPAQVLGRLHTRGDLFATVQTLRQTLPRFDPTGGK